MAGNYVGIDSGNTSHPVSVLYPGEYWIWGWSSDYGIGVMDRRLVYVGGFVGWNYDGGGFWCILPDKEKERTNPVHPVFIAGNGGSIILCIENGRDTLQ